MNSQGIAAQAFAMAVDCQHHLTFVAWVMPLDTRARDVRPAHRPASASSAQTPAPEQARQEVAR
jgi:hypothetical protein